MSMLVVPAVLNGRHSLDVLLASGAEAGLWLAADAANRAGIVLAHVGDSIDLPRDIQRVPIPGRWGRATIEIVGSNTAVPVRVFSPDRDFGESFVGADYLTAVAAQITIGDVQFDFQARRNPRTPRPAWSGREDDFSDWIVPLHRPRRPR